jgi:hypothetical protein
MEEPKNNDIIEEPKKQNFKDIIINHPIIAVIVLSFLAMTGVVSFVITMFELNKAAINDRRMAEIAEVRAEKSQEVERLTSLLEGIRRTNHFNLSKLNACEVQLEAKKKALESLVSIPQQEVLPKPVQKNLEQCNKKLALLDRSNRILDRSNKINESTIEGLRGEIKRLSVDRVKKKTEELRQQSVKLEKNSTPVRVIGEVDIVLLNVSENKLNVNFEYTIDEKKYSAIYIPQKAIIGHKIGSYLYLFHVLDSNAKTPETAKINAMRIFMK